MTVPALAATAPYLVAYDIRSAARLRRVHRHLAGEAYAVQYSLFAADWSTADCARIISRLTTLIQADSDDVRIFRIPLSAAGFSLGEQPWTQDVFTVSGQAVDLLRRLPSRPHRSWGKT